jgi:hypothetical protein
MLPLDKRLTADEIRDAVAEAPVIRMRDVLDTGRSFLDVTPAEAATWRPGNGSRRNCQTCGERFRIKGDAKCRRCGADRVDGSTRPRGRGGRQVAT